MSSNREIINGVLEKVWDLENIDDEIIYDVNNFVRELDRAGLMTDELKDFIENYLRWDNN